jgi:hypothetical protein
MTLKKWITTDQIICDHPSFPCHPCAILKRWNTDKRRKNGLPRIRISVIIRPFRVIRVHFFIRWNTDKHRKNGSPRIGKSVIIRPFSVIRVHFFIRWNTDKHRKNGSPRIGKSVIIRPFSVIRVLYSRLLVCWADPYHKPTPSGTSYFQFIPGRYMGSQDPVILRFPVRIDSIQHNSRIIVSDWQKRKINCK